MSATAFPAAAIVSGVFDAARLASGTATEGFVITADASGDPVWSEATGGGGAAWGDITGTLSDQTDLQTALDAKYESGDAASFASVASTGNITSSGNLVITVASGITASIGKIGALVDRVGYTFTAGANVATLYLFSGSSFVMDLPGGLFVRTALAAPLFSVDTLGNLTATAGLQCVNITSTGTFRSGVYTVATLPTASSNAGRIAQVTDSSVTTNGSTVSGGGANRVMVFSNGTNWLVVI